MGTLKLKKGKGVAQPKVAGAELKCGPDLLALVHCPGGPLVLSLLPHSPRPESIDHGKARFTVLDRHRLNVKGHW